jgi:hypothetical protein
MSKVSNHFHVEAAPSQTYAKHIRLRRIVFNYQSFDFILGVQ